MSDGQGTLAIASMLGEGQGTLAIAVSEGQGTLAMTTMIELGDRISCFMFVSWTMSAFHCGNWLHGCSDEAEADEGTGCE